MALGSTGAMRMGADVNVELGSASTTQISLGQASVRTLIGVPSGAVMFPTNFYGKSAASATALFFGGTTTTCSNLVTRINTCGALIGSQTNVGTAREAPAGAKVGLNAMFYGGSNIFYVGQKVTRVNKCGALVGSETSIADYKDCTSGALVGSNGLFYGGGIPCGNVGYSVSTNAVVRINACGAKVGSTTYVGTGRTYIRGARIGSNGVFWSGFFSYWYCNCGSFNQSCGPSNKITRINACGALVGESTLPASGCRYCYGAASVSSNTFGLFYGGIANGEYSNKVTRINACAVINGSETNVGTSRTGMGGADLCTVGLFYGGFASTARTNAVTRINPCRAIVGSESNIGTSRYKIGGAGLS